LSLPADFAARAESFYHLLRKWNSTTNLTSLPIEGYADESIDRLLIEPLIAAELIPNKSALFCVDVGSGGGSPAIPFALARPLVRLLMVESIAKKAAFLREAVRTIQLPQAVVKHARFEDLALELKHTIDVVLIRGVRITSGLSKSLQLGLKSDGKLFAFGTSPDLPHVNWRLTSQRSLSGQSTLLTFQVQR
jgi:16S rRNA (guanine527-N7)-methyltransferase